MEYHTFPWNYFYSIILSRMLLENIQDTILISVHCNNPSSMVSTDGVRELSEKEGKMIIFLLFLYSLILNTSSQYCVVLL